VASSVNTRKINELFLPHLRLAENITATNSQEEALTEAVLVLWAIPVQYTRAIVKVSVNYFRPEVTLVNLSKGLEESTWYRPSQILLQECPGLRRVGSLVGPNIAAEVSRGMTAQATLAIANHWEVQGLEKLLSSPTYRVTLSPDLITVEVAGALKNVIAIAAGLCDGLGLGDNGKSVVVAKGFEEMQAVGRAMGANPDSFVSAFALGDLLVTCFSPGSRNRSLGELLGSGRTWAEANRALHGRVAEGAATSKVSSELCGRLGLDLLLMRSVHLVIQGQLKPADLVRQVLA
jgi:glycerol-3-phosphate dehydrogenase (NAD(P)+)